MADHGNRAPLLPRLQDHAPVDKVAGRVDGGGFEGRGVAVGGEGDGCEGVGVDVDRSIRCARTDSRESWYTRP